MSDAFLPLTQQQVDAVLAVNVLPSLNLSQQTCLIRRDDELLFNANAAKPNEFNHGARVVAFGPGLTSANIRVLIDALCQDRHSLLALNQYQPIDSMAPALVICGITPDETLKPLLAELAQSLTLELVQLDTPPSLLKPGVLLMDMDSTAIEIECIDEIAVLAGVGEAVAAVTKRAMQGELDFSQSLISRVATLKGADESVLARVADNLPLMPGLETLVTELKQRGWVVAIASGGFTYFTEKLKAQLDLTATFANQLDIIDGRLTGKVVGDIVDAQVKATVVAQLAQQHGIDASQTVAIGDGANDLKMLAKAALGVAFHAKPLVRQQAKAAVNHGGLEQLLYLLLPHE